MGKSVTFSPPWAGGVFADFQVRAEYASGLWDYALGKPATAHDRYSEAVKSAKGRFNPWWIRTWQDVEAVLDGCWFDDDAALKILNVLSKYVQYPADDGGGSIQLMDWQVYHLIAPLYGWKRENGLRRFVRGVVWIPKKNGKSFLCSLLALYHLLKDGEPGPEVYVTAGDRDQAGIVYDESSALAKASPAFAKRLRFVDSRRRIFSKTGRGKYRVLSREAKLAEGIKWSAMFLDELHIQDRRMWNTVKGGGVSRKQPLMLAISTAGVFDPASIGYEQWEYSEKVHNGEVSNPSYFSLMFRAFDESDWDNEEVWQKANPSWGDVLNPDSYRELCREAKTNPAERSGFLRYHLNIWTQTAAPWVDMDDWRKCAGQYDESELDGLDCYGGLDLSQQEDITAFVLLYPPQRGVDKYRLLCRFWLPEMNVAKLGDEAGAPYWTWARDGWLHTTPGNIIDYQFIRKEINDLASKCYMVNCQYDRYQGTSIVTDLIGDGIDMHPHAQTTTGMNAPTLELAKLIRTGELEHNNNPVMNWMVSNCQLVMDSGGQVKITKSDGGGVNKKGLKRYKVDGAVAAVMAMSGCASAESYQGGGLIVSMNQKENER